MDETSIVPGTPPLNPVDATQDAITQFKQQVNNGEYTNQDMANYYAGTPSPLQTPAFLNESVTAAGTPVPSAIQKPAPAKPIVGQKEQYVDQAQVQAPTQAQPQAQETMLGVPQQSGIDSQIEAQRAIAKAAQDKANAEAAAYEQQNKMNADLVAKQQAHAAKFEADWSKQVDELKNLSNQMQDLSNAKIDSQSFWNSKSTGEKILGALAIGLGGVSAAYLGTENGALKIIQTAIDRDIDAQKANLDTQKQVVGNKIQIQQNMMSQLRAKYGDDLAAEQAMRALSNDMVLNKVKAISARTEGTVAQQNAKILEAQLTQQRDAALQQMKLRLQIMGTGSGADENNRYSYMQLKMAGLPDDEIKGILENQSKQVAGYRGQAKDKESATEFQKINSNLQKGISAVEDYIKMTKNFTVKPKDSAKIESMRNLLVGSLREAVLGPGTVTDAEYERLLGTIGSPNDWLKMSDAQRARTLNVLNQMRKNLATEAKVYGFTPLDNSSTIERLKQLNKITPRD